MNTMKTVAAALVAACAIAPLSASAAEKTTLGSLECTVEGGIGLLITSNKQMTCTFTETNGASENYTGSIRKLGLDVGVTGESYIKWVVVTPAGSEIGEHALAGSYAGVSTGVTLGIGLGANALIGGKAENIGLQPVSVEGQTGVNIALALTSLTLEAAR
jgi:hypothetical protein